MPLLLLHPSYKIPVSLHGETKFLVSNLANTVLAEKGS